MSLLKISFLLLGSFLLADFGDASSLPYQYYGWPNQQYNPWSSCHQYPYWGNYYQNPYQRYPYQRPWGGVTPRFLGPPIPAPNSIPPYFGTSPGGSPPGGPLPGGPVAADYALSADNDVLGRRIIDAEPIDDSGLGLGPDGGSALGPDGGSLGPDGGSARGAAANQDAAIDAAAREAETALAAENSAAKSASAPGFAGERGPQRLSFPSVPGNIIAILRIVIKACKRFIFAWHPICRFLKAIGC